MGTPRASLKEFFARHASITGQILIVLVGTGIIGQIVKCSQDSRNFDLAKTQALDAMNKELVAAQRELVAISEEHLAVESALKADNSQSARDRVTGIRVSRHLAAQRVVDLEDAIAKLKRRSPRDLDVRFGMPPIPGKPYFNGRLLRDNVPLASRALVARTGSVVRDSLLNVEVLVSAVTGDSTFVAEIFVGSEWGWCKQEIRIGTLFRNNNRPPYSIIIPMEINKVAGLVGFRVYEDPMAMGHSQLQWQMSFEPDLAIPGPPRPSEIIPDSIPGTLLF